jgi:hypothetical protein
VAETSARHRQDGRGRQTRSRLGGTLSRVPLWAKGLGAFAVGAAAVAGGVAEVVPLFRSSPPPILAVELGPPEWSGQNLTLGRYVAWQLRESGSLGLKALGGNEAAQAPSGRAGGTGLAPIAVRLVRYASHLHEVSAGSAQSTSAAQTGAAETSTTTTGGEPDRSGVSSGSEEGPSSTTTTAPAGGPSTTTVHPTHTSSTAHTSSTGTGSTGTIAKPPTNPELSLRAGVLREAADNLGRTDVAHLQSKAQRQEEILRNPKLQPSAEVLSACQGVAFGGCAPEATVEPTSEPLDEQTTAVGSPPPTGEGAPGTSTGRTEPSPSSSPQHLSQSERELLEIAGGARLGPAEDASLIPPLTIAGLSSTQRVRVASVLGDVVSFEVHTHGWIGQRLLLTWTMYEKQDGYWDPSDHEYLIDHADTYIVPAASNDEGILTFWFPIPRQRGDYEVRYFIRAPGSGEELATGKTQSFRS